MRSTQGRSRLCAVLAAAAYLALSLWFFREPLREPSRRVAFPVRASGQEESPIGVLDQAMSIAVVARNARVATTRPWDLFGGQLCYPMPRPHTLGEHMLGTGLLAAPAFAVTRDPIASYNVALVATLWVPAIAMYAFVFAFTRSPPAAFVSGLLFGFFPVRIGDPAHPFTHGDLWTPLVLLFTHRLFARSRWRDALGFGAFFGLQMMESFYSVLECLTLLGVFGGWVVWRHRRRLSRALPKVAVAAAIAATVTWLVFAPYLATRSEWALLSARDGWLNFPSVFGPGGLYYPGTVAAGLVTLALLDRVWRRPSRGHAGDDPRWAMAIAGLAAAWVSLGPIPLGSTGWSIPAPLRMLHGIVPGVDAVRVPGLVGYGFNLACTFLAGFGVLALGRLHPRWALAPAALGVTALALYERVDRSTSIATFSRTTELEVTDALRPDDAAIAVVRSLEGPVLELPTPLGRKLGMLQGQSAQMLLAAYHPHPTSSCYNSFAAPVARQVWTLANRLPDARAAAALAAIGFQGVVVHERFLRPVERSALSPAALAEGTSGLLPRERAGGLSRFDLIAGAPAREDWSLLGASETGSDDAPPASVTRGEIEIVVANRGEETFVHPKPPAPSPVIARWHRQGNDENAPVHTSRERALLPLSLAPGDSLPVRVAPTSFPPPGVYEVTLSREVAPSLVLGRAIVRIGPATAELGDKPAASDPGSTRLTSPGRAP